MERRSGSPVPFRIGYALVQKKINSFLQEKLRNESKRKGVELVQIDLSRPLVEQGPFDAILHKVPSRDWYLGLLAYQRQFPDVVIIDPPEAVERLKNRISMLQAVADGQMSSDDWTVGVPKQTVVESMECLHDAASHLRFPVIAKPLVVDGTKKGHLMWLVYNEIGLNKLNPPFVLQEFVNHGGVIFKAYVVGNHVKCVRRISLPDCYESDLRNPEGLKSFCQVSNLTGLHRRAAEVIDASLADTELPPSDLLAAVASRLRLELGLQLFNFDLIRDHGQDNHYCIVDINYFPGFAKMPGYEQALSDFFVSLARQKSYARGGEGKHDMVRDIVLPPSRTDSKGLDAVSCIDFAVAACGAVGQDAQLD